MNLEEVRKSDVRFLLGGTKFKAQWDWLIEQAEKVEILEKIQHKKLIGWCCTECEENFYLDKEVVEVSSLSVSCPHCGEFKYTVCNTF